MKSNETAASAFSFPPSGIQEHFSKMGGIQEINESRNYAENLYF
jgi:hypothetical protein